MTKKKRITVSLPGYIADQLQFTSDRVGMTKSELLESCLDLIFSSGLFEKFDLQEDN